MNTKTQYKQLFEAFCSVENIDAPTLFEAMLYDWTQKFLESRAKDIDVDPELFEALEEGVERAFGGTVLYKSKYVNIDQVPLEHRSRIQERMSR